MLVQVKAAVLVGSERSEFGEKTAKSRATRATLYACKHECACACERSARVRLRVRACVDKMDALRSVFD